MSQAVNDLLQSDLIAETFSAPGIIHPLSVSIRSPGYPPKVDPGS